MDVCSCCVCELLPLVYYRWRNLTACKQEWKYTAVEEIDTEARLLPAYQFYTVLYQSYNQ